MLLLVVIEGRSVVSFSLIRIRTSNTFESEFGRCSPIFATLVTTPVNFLLGSESRPVVTTRPFWIFWISTSFTYVMDSIVSRSGRVATIGSHGLIVDPTTRFLPPHSL